MLYGAWQDFSAPRIGMIVRDARDEQVATICYSMAERKGWITIETAAGSFEADVLPALKQRVVVHPSGNERDVRCTFTRFRWGAFRFELPQLGALESRPPRALRLAPMYRYSLSGSPVGVTTHIGG
ncbi:MAG: hypothetical protein ACRENQ_14830 [Gemmatimonadaceae bacterium]